LLIINRQTSYHDTTMQIVIIGNSAAGLSALEAFRKEDRTSFVTIVTKEGENPYSRVLLPYYLRGKVSYDHLFIRDKDYYDRQKANCITGKVVKLLAEEKAVLLEGGTRLSYDKLLIATGSSPVKPPIPGLSGEGIHHLWTLEDATKLALLFQKGQSAVVLGSGFVSLQGAWAALSRGVAVSVVELMDRIMPRALDEQAAAVLANRMTDLGVDLRVATVTQEIERSDDGQFVLHFKDGRSLTADFIIVGTGVRPNVDFTSDTGMRIDAGIVVNKQMETNLPGIYAAGDVAQVPSFLGGEPVVHALWPTAIETGSIAGTSMAVGKSDYSGSLNMNVTQMFNITVASMGEFIEAEGDEIWLDDSLPEDQYLKIVLRDSVPVGATCAGDSDLISTLGMLRPLIREKVRIQGKPGTIKAMMAQNLSRHHHAFVK
jgi:nitrite reductase (NADH) large subunit